VPVYPSVPLAEKREDLKESKFLNLAKRKTHLFSNTSYQKRKFIK